MTEYAVLTDDQLMAIDSAHTVCADCEVHRLIATLRSCREDAERLRDALWRAPEDWLKGDDDAWFALTGERGEWQ